MTDIPTVLPGLPQPPEQPRELTDVETCTLNLQVAIAQLCGAALADNPDLNPADAAGNVGNIVAQTLISLMAPQAARLGVLVAFEQMHDEAMSVFDVQRATEALNQLAIRRRRQSRVTKGGVIVPGKE